MELVSRFSVFVEVIQWDDRKLLRWGFFVEDGFGIFVLAVNLGVLIKKSFVVAVNGLTVLSPAQGHLGTREGERERERGERERSIHAHN